MPQTTVPIMNTPDYEWSTGSGKGGIFGKKRVTIYDKITKNDINQLRDVVEVLSEHYHDYTDRTGC